jgi:hypothetical protein
MAGPARDAAWTLQQFQVWTAQQPLIQFASQSTGGWERWAQIDFSAYLNAGGTQTICEDAPFAEPPAPNGTRNDLTVLGPPGPGACVEFKVYNHLSETLVEYRNRLWADQLKLETYPLIAHRATNEKIAIGIARRAQVLTALQFAYPTVNAGNYLNPDSPFRTLFGAFSHVQVQSPTHDWFVISSLHVNYMHDDIAMALGGGGGGTGSGGTGSGGGGGGPSSGPSSGGSKPGNGGSTSTGSGSKLVPGSLSTGSTITVPTLPSGGTVSTTAGSKAGPTGASTSSGSTGMSTKMQIG